MRGEEGGRACRPGKGIHLIRKVALSEFQRRAVVSRRTSLEGVSGFRVRHVIDRVDREAGRPWERLFGMGWRGPIGWPREMFRK